MIPNRLNRFCCNYFKEGATVEYFDENERISFLFGIRNQESQQRSDYGDVIRNPKWAHRDWIGILPIRGWSEFDVWLYTLREGIEINEKYRYGYSRVGCGIACPYYTKYTWVLDKFWYPYLFKRWRDILRSEFISENKWLIMNCTIEEYTQKAWCGGVFREEPTEDVVREFAEHNGLDIEVAAKYFNRYCANGCLNKRKMPQKIKQKDVLAMNMKFHGRHIERFLCKKCLQKELDIDDAGWDSYVARFKQQGCQLF